MKLYKKIDAFHSVALDRLANNYNSSRRAISSYAIHINFFRIVMQCLLPSVAVATAAAVGTAGASTAAVLALQYYLHPSQPIHLAQIFQFVKFRLEPRPYAV
jgi:hypothetical protein